MIKETTGKKSLLDISPVTVAIMIEHTAKNSNEILNLYFFILISLEFQEPQVYVRWLL